MLITSFLISSPSLKFTISVYLFIPVLSNLLKVLNGSPFPRTMKSLENSHAILLLLVETKVRDFLTHDKRLDLFVCLFVCFYLKGGAPFFSQSRAKQSKSRSIANFLSIPVWKPLYNLSAPYEILKDHWIIRWPVTHLNRVYCNGQMAMSKDRIRNFSV